LLLAPRSSNFSERAGGSRSRFINLALIFDRPVLLSVGLPDGPAGAVLHSSPRFDPRPGEKRSEGLQRARVHFQAFLRQLEELLFQQPNVWFNFTPLNPPAAAPAPSIE